MNPARILKRVGLQLFMRVGALVVRLARVGGQRCYMRVYRRYLSFLGVTFRGTPEYIAPSCRFDLHADIEIGNGAVISENVSILTHDYSLSIGLEGSGESLDEPLTIVKGVIIGDRAFIGFGALLLPGTKIGSYSIVGGGAVVRGVVPEKSVVIGNPATVVGSSTAWACARKLRAGGVDISKRSELSRRHAVRVK